MLRAEDEPEATPAPAVVVVDDNDLFRSGLVSLLVDVGIDVVGEADSAPAALQLLAVAAPSVVLVDLDLPDTSGVGLVRKLVVDDPDLQVVVLVDSESEGIIEALLAGACCHLLRDASPDDIRRVVVAAAQGESTIAPELVSKFVRRVRTNGAVGQVPNDPYLNERELDVLRLLTEGCDNREIATRLFISTSTVKHHVSSIIAKLGVANRIQAAVRAVRDGLI